MAKKKLPRDPVQSNALRRVRNSHKRYRRTGNKAVDAARQAPRDDALWDQQELLAAVYESLRPLAEAEPASRDWRAARARLKHAFEEDALLRTDLSRVRFGGAMEGRDLVLCCVEAAAKFRKRIDETTTGSGLSRRERDRERQQAWKDFDATLSSVAISFLSLTYKNNADLKTTAMGSLH